MQRSFTQTILTASALTIAAIAAQTTGLFGNIQPVSAQEVAPTASATPGLKGHYVGAGVVGGFQTGDNGDSQFAGTVTGRYALGDALSDSLKRTVPVSLRGTAQFNGQNASFQPMVTYDVAIAKDTNLYLGGGGSLLLNDKKSPLGDRNAWALTAGLEGQVAKNTVLFGDVRWGINAFEGSKDDAISVQVGAGYKF